MRSSALATQRITRRLSLIAPAVAVLAGGPHTDTQPKPVGETVAIRLLGVNDFHGHLQSPGSLPRGRNGRPVAVGGAAVLASHLDRAAAKAPGRTIRVHAGDMVGASPLLSSHFHDEPTVRAMNLMRFDVGTVGNHEFDEGAAEMLRLLRGGRRRGRAALKRDPPGRLVNTSDPRFPGVSFPYVAANTVDRHGRLLLPPYRIVRRGGVEVGFIGVTTETTPRYLLARHARKLRFLDISRAVNRYVADLRRRGVSAIVVLAHSGAFEARGAAAARGEIVDEVRQMSDEVDVVVAGHTHSRLNVRVPNRSGQGEKLVVEAFSFGTAYDRVEMTVHRETGDVLAKSADIPRTWAREVRPHQRIAALVRGYARRLAPLAERLVGRADDDLVRRPPGTGESLGALAADAQRALAHADIAVVNQGSARADLAPGRISYEAAFAAQPYEHRVLRIQLTGADVRALLEQQFQSEGTVRLHVSGLRSEDSGGRVGRVVLENGRPLQPDAVYSVAANELLATGDRFSVLRDRGRHARAVGTDLEALVQAIGRGRAQ